MNKKRIFIIILFIFLGFFIHTMANPSEKQVDNFDKNVEHELENNNIVGIIDVSKLETAINNGINLINNNKMPNSSIKELLIGLNELIEKGKKLLSSNDRTQDKIDYVTEEINRKIGEINKIDKNTNKPIEEDNKQITTKNEQKLLNDISDTKAPIGIITTSNNQKPTNKNVIVTLTVDKDIICPNGWNKVNNNTYVREYETNGIFQMIITDLSGNISVINYEVAGIDKLAPIVTEIEENGVYANSVTAIITDENLDVVTLNGKIYISGTTITDANDYILIAKDKAGNVTTVKFKVEKRYTVTFKNREEIVSVQSVSSADELCIPNVDSYTKNDVTYEFSKWDNDLTIITSDLEVNALYNISKIDAGVYELLLDNANKKDKSNYSFLKKISLNLTDDILDITKSNIKTTLVADNVNILSYISDANTMPDANMGYKYNWYLLKYEPDFGWRIEGRQEKLMYKVVFMNDGVIYDEQEVEYGNSAEEPIKPIKSATKQYSYVFIGWNKEFDNIVDNMIINAKYQEITNKYKVTFVTNLGTTLNTQQVEYGKNAIIPMYSKELYNNDIKYIYSSMTDNYTNITDDTIVTVTYRLADKSVFKAYLLYDLYTNPGEGKPDSSLKYYRVKKKSKLEIVDDANGSLARVVNKANNSKNKEAVLALGIDEINKYLTNETKKELATLNGKDIIGRKYRINWYVLKYNANDNTWHLDGEKKYYE